MRVDNLHLEDSTRSKRSKFPVSLVGTAIERKLENYNENTLAEFQNPLTKFGEDVVSDSGGGY